MYTYISVSEALHLFHHTMTLKWLSVTCISVTVHLHKCNPMALIQVTSLTGWGHLFVACDSLLVDVLVNCSNLLYSGIHQEMICDYRLRNLLNHIRCNVNISSIKDSSINTDASQTHNMNPFLKITKRVRSSRPPRVSIGKGSGAGMSDTSNRPCKK